MPKVYQEVHEEVDDIGGDVWEVGRALVDGVHQQVPVLGRLLQLLVLRLHYLLLQHHHHLRINDTQSTLQHPYRPPGPDDAGSLSLSPSSVLIQANAQWKSKLIVPLASFVIPVFGAELCAQASTAQ